MTFCKGRLLYKQLPEDIPAGKWQGVQWFALSENYGSYGQIRNTYVLQKDLKLLDIGNGNVREMIERRIEPFDKQILRYDPDEQYSGGQANKKYHKILETYFGHEFDGTIIDSENLRDGEKYLAKDLDGATEVVLWKNYSDLKKA